MRSLLVYVALASALWLGGCLERAGFPIEASYGPAPTLPPPDPSVVPTIDVAPARGWPDGRTPVAAEGLRVDALARGLVHPRWLYVLPNGDVLVAETNAPAQSGASGLRAWLMKRVKTRAGNGVPSADRITLLRDADGDGRPELRTVFAEGLRSPFGMALVGDDLYVAETNALRRFDYREAQERLASPGAKVADLPAGDINRHWTKNVVASANGERLYVAVGSNSNVGERGLEHEKDRAAILEVDPRSGRTRVYASGLRNPVGLAWHPDTRALWTTVNERDEIGSDLVPDYLTRVVEGGFYGWPYSYFGAHVDERVQPPRPDLVAAALVPDYALGAHTASLGLAFYDAGLLPAPYRGGAFVGQHGSWNRRPPSGYAVIFVPFAGGLPAGPPRSVLNGFVDEDGKAFGRPAGVAVDREGALLVADDAGGVVWRVTPAP
jgi:glucose/arabinose dehydrogenase